VGNTEYSDQLGLQVQYVVLLDGSKFAHYLPRILITEPVSYSVTVLLAEDEKCIRGPMILDSKLYEFLSRHSIFPGLFLVRIP